MAWRLLSVALLGILASCGGTWVEDGGNFKRVFGFSKPPEVTVLHSYYWKSPHWSVEYSYFIVLQASPKFVAGVTSSDLMTAVAPDGAALNICGGRMAQVVPPEATWQLRRVGPQKGCRLSRFS